MFMYVCLCACMLPFHLFTQGGFDTERQERESETTSTIALLKNRDLHAAGCVTPAVPRFSLLYLTLRALDPLAS